MVIMRRVQQLTSLIIAVILAAPSTLAAQRRANEEMKPSALSVDTTVYSRLRWRHGKKLESIIAVQNRPTP
jgi:Ni/Co efflux regulator RcnB